MSSGRLSDTPILGGLYYGRADFFTLNGQAPHRLSRRKRDRVGRMTIRFLLDDPKTPSAEMYRAIGEQVPEVRELTVKQYGRRYPWAIKGFVIEGLPDTDEFHDWELDQLPLLLELAMKINPAGACAIMLRHPESADQLPTELVERTWKQVEECQYFSGVLLTFRLLAGLPDAKVAEEVTNRVILHGISHHRGKVREKAFRLLEFVEGV